MLHTLLMPLSDFDHQEKGDALYGRSNIPFLLIIMSLNSIREVVIAPMANCSVFYHFVLGYACTIIRCPFHGYLSASIQQYNLHAFNYCCHIGI